MNEATERRRAPEPEYGFPRVLWRGLGRIPVPPPLHPATWRSPLRGPWLTSVFGMVLLLGMPVVILTGLLSWMAYGPQFGNAMPADVGYLRLPLFAWPTDPPWLFRLNQGLHTIGGVVLTPIVLAKLWSVMPKLFAWPPVRSIGGLLERLSLIALVGGVIFQFVTGLMNMQYDYSFGFSFYTAHYWGAWVFIAGFVTHVIVKLPTMVRSLRSGPGGTGAFGRWLHDTPATTEPEPVESGERLETPQPGGDRGTDGEPGGDTGRDTDGEPDGGTRLRDGVLRGPVVAGLAPLAPSTPTMSRRGMLTMVGAGSLLAGGLTIGQTVDALRPYALLSPRGQSYGDGPNDFQINRTVDGAGIDRVALETDTWTLTLTGGPEEVVLTREDLLAMPLHTATLPLACVEGWSVTRDWTGVRLSALAGLAGVASPETAFVQSVETAGPFASTTIANNQVMHPDSLLALRVGLPGEGRTVDLSPDHGFPARMIVPAMPGVRNTKWVASMDFRTGDGPGASGATGDGPGASGATGNGLGASGATGEGPGAS